MHKFYDTKGLTLENKKNILIQALQLSFSSWVDELDCKKSWARQSSGISPLEMVQLHLSNSCHFVIIERDPINSNEKSYMEIGFSTMSREVNLFLFIYIDIEKASDLINNYELKPLN